MSISKLVDAKRTVLSTVFENAETGISESQALSILYDYDDAHKIFEYGMNGITPETIIESLIAKGLIIRICQNGPKECKIYVDNNLIGK